MQFSKKFETEASRKCLNQDTCGYWCSIPIYVGIYIQIFENFYIKDERVLALIAISAREKQIIAEQYPDVHIRRTVKQKSKRHRYYMEENKNAMRILKSLRKPE